MLLIVITGKYIVFFAYRRSYLLCPPVISRLSVAAFDCRQKYIICLDPFIQLHTRFWAFNLLGICVEQLLWRRFWGQAAWKLCVRAFFAVLRGLNLNIYSHVLGDTLLGICVDIIFAVRQGLNLTL